MFGHILLAAVAATAVPSPTPSPAASPVLKTIANIRASARCSDIVTHANNAIDSSLEDNHVISQSITELRMVNLDDGNLMHRNAGLAALRELASSLHKQSAAGDGEIKALRALAAKATDPQEGKELKAFADALGGAIGRQLKMARDFDGYLAYVDYLDNRGLSAGGSPMDNDFFAPDPYAPAAVRSRYSATAYAENAAKDFQARFPAIIRDENTAASHADAAFEGC